MSLETNRREFLKTSATVCVAAPIALSMSGVVGAALASNVPDFSASTAVHNGDLLRALGSRIGLEAAQRVAPNGEAVSLMYFDGAGSNLDALREGIEQGLAWQCDSRVAMNEVAVPYSAMLGVAVVRNLETAVETRVEIDATALSQLAMIEANSTSQSVQKQAVMSASADCFFRVSDLNA
jgi:hypothetical protein